jgi:diguanylate cyclase
MNVPIDEHERTLAFAETALGQIKALGQSAAPRNFEIWYHYATGYNQPLNQTINETLAQKGSLDDDDLDQIYETYISDTRFGERIDTVGTRVLDEIKQVMSTIDAATGSASSYSQRLTAASEKLAQAKDGKGLDSDALRAVIEHLAQGANEMEASNRKLEARLAATRQEMEQLQNNLEAVRTESLTDQLTSLANRKYFDAALAQGISEAAAKSEPLSLLMADIDHFKTFNDRFGHLTGDQVLRLVALSVKQNVKNSDRRALWRRGIRHRAAQYAARCRERDRRPDPPLGDDQGTDETVDRRAARAGDDFHRRRLAAAGGQCAAPDRARRPVPLRSQAQRPQQGYLRERRRGQSRNHYAGAGGLESYPFLASVSGFK